MPNKDAFSSCHPVTSILFFALVIVYSMLLMHPVYLAVSLAASAAYLISLRGRRGVRFCVGYMLPMALLAAVVNPAFNHAGVTILT